jgi:UDP-MurNAc hydroxylase
MNTTIEWVNHAGFVFSAGSTRLLCDPWLEGTAFNNGWRLLAPSVFSPRDFGSITHIWFSHQHPDHFSPRDLRRIQAEDRARITVLYHKTIDKKVVRFCDGLHFQRCIELEDRAPADIAGDVRVLCGAWDDRDSWIAIRANGLTYLNVNDCVIQTEAQARSIAKAVGPVDVLLTQFSYANWAGNPGDEQEHRRLASEKRDEIGLQTRVFKPSIVVPFASFVWFSHQENFFHNAQMNQVGDIARFIMRDLGCKAVVLYPGDRWTYGEPHDSQTACARYAADFRAALERGPIDTSASVSSDTVTRAMEGFLKRVKARNPIIRFIPGLTTSVRVTDWERSFQLDLSGMRQIAAGASVDIKLSSDSLLFALRTPWGANALAVNGRYVAPARGEAARFFRFFRAADLNDHGRCFGYRWAASRFVKAVGGGTPLLTLPAPRSSL